MSSLDIIATHFSEAGFLWGLRDAAVGDAAYTLPALAALDEPEPGGVFTALFVAVGCRDWAAVARVLEAAASPELLRSAVAALAWSPFSELEPILTRVLDASAGARLHEVGVAACAAHRIDWQGALSRAVHAEDPALRSRALRGCGELGKRDAAADIGFACAATDARVRFWAAWSGALFGDRNATALLATFAQTEGPFAVRACETVMRRSDPATRSWIESSTIGPRARVALAGAAASGDPAFVPWLLERMAVPELARLAGEAMHRITGAELSRGGLRGVAPEGFQSGPTDDPDDEDVAADPDDSLAWPNLEAVGAWWMRARAELKPGTRYLLGSPIAADGWLETMLREGSQPVRAAAAEELMMSGRRAALFEVRAQGSVQLRQLGA